LSRLLRLAADKLSAVHGPIWSSYESGPELASFVLACAAAVERGHIQPAQRRELWMVFAPTCDWDDVVGDAELGNAVFELLDQRYGSEIRGG
jgi:hypothetical protein